MAFIKIILLSAGLLTTGGVNAKLPPMTKKQKQCVVSTVYHEANLKDNKDILFTTDLIMNRAKQSGKSFCSVVHESGQFESHKLLKSGKVSRADLSKDADKKTFNKVKVIVDSVHTMQKHGVSVTNGATHMLKHGEKTTWSKKMKRVVSNSKGNDFYRSKES